MSDLVDAIFKRWKEEEKNPSEEIEKMLASRSKRKRKENWASGCPN